MISGALVFAAVPALTGCNVVSQALCNIGFCGTNAPTASPGTFSYFALISFTNGQNFPPDCLLSTDTACDYEVQQQLAAPLQAQSWSLQTGVTDGFINSAWTSPETTASNINGITSSFLYVTSHGGIINGQAQICLRDCNGQTVGATLGFGTQTIPASWNGPNWLMLDACDAVVPNVGWEQKFGGSLHGIFGWNSNVSGLSNSGLNTLARLVAGYDTALDAWEQATATTSDSTSATALVPSPNSQDAIEAPGGPNFGYNGDGSPAYYAINNSGQFAAVLTQNQSLLSAVPQSIYSLNPEQMNESYWYNYYGGSALTGKISHPSANEDLYRDQNVLVDHYLSSGGLIVSTERTGTAIGFSESSAYDYAQSWISANGGLPPDAVLTYAGAETNSQWPTISTVASEPYPNVTQYVFIWRHGSSGIVANDKIEIRIDDAGGLSKKTIEITSPHCNCTIPEVISVLPWVPSFHMHTYVRIWRTLGSPISSAVNALSLNTSAFGYCSSDMSNVASEAQPCGVVGTASGRNFLSTQTGTPIASSE